MKEVLKSVPEIEEVPKKWILNFSTSIQGKHNESIGITPVGPM